MEEYKSKVYALSDSNSRIIAIDGGYTVGNIKDFSGWVLVDEGTGDKYNLCQSNYLDSPLMTDDGIYRWKLVDSKCVLRSDAEIETDRENRPMPEPTAEERMDALEALTDDIVLFMADIIGG